MGNGIIINNKKTCTKCLTSKDITYFYNRSDKPHLLTSRCKDCICLDNKLSADKYKERQSKQQSIYHLKNREKRIEYSRMYSRLNRDKRNARFKTRYDTDVNFRLTQNIRNRIRSAIKNNSKSNTTNKLIGCTIIELKIYIQNLFTEGMSWDNYGLWQIDHIMPCASFDMSIIEQQQICFHYSNLQPLWAIDNLIKKDKIIKKEVYYR